MPDPLYTPPPQAPDEASTGFDIAEEYGTARKSLPPAGIVAICVIAALILLLSGYVGYAGVVFAVAIAAGINLR